MCTWLFWLLLAFVILSSSSPTFLVSRDGCFYYV
nr:MAG TPA: hypothetical protein [Caudoviricetes sp.]